MAVSGRNFRPLTAMAPNGVITVSGHHWLTCPLLVVMATSCDHWLTLAIMLAFDFNSQL
jgi:hypothetical protein